MIIALFIVACSGPRIAQLKFASKVCKCVTMKMSLESTIGCTLSTSSILIPRKCLLKSDTTSLSAIVVICVQNYTSLSITIEPTDRVQKNKLTVQTTSILAELIGGVPHNLLYCQNRAAYIR